MTFVGHPARVLGMSHTDYRDSDDWAAVLGVTRRTVNRKVAAGDPILKPTTKAPGHRGAYLWSPEDYAAQLDALEASDLKRFEDDLADTG